MPGLCGRALDAGPVRPVRGPARLGMRRAPRTLKCGVWLLEAPRALGCRGLAMGLFWGLLEAPHALRCRGCGACALGCGACIPV